MAENPRKASRAATSHASSRTTSLDRRSFLGAAAGAAVASASVAAIASAPAALAEEAPAGSGSTELGGTEELQPANRWQTPAGAAWRQRPAVVDESLVSDGGTFDVVVIGGGNSGTWAARSASMNGASVAVLEAQSEDGFLYIGGQVGAINSQWGIAHGAQEVDTNELLNELCRRNAARSNQKLLRQYVEHSGEFLDWAIADIDAGWLEDNAHVIAADRTENVVMDPSGFKYFASTVIFRDKDETRGGAVWMWGPGVVSKHRERAIADGAAWMWGTRAELIETDAEGRAVSVLATPDDGASYVRLTATKGVVIAAGDFNGNRDMLLDLNDEYRHLAESFGDLDLAQASDMMGYRQGWGLRLGVWAGGHPEVGPHAGMSTGMTGPIGTNKAPWGPGMPLLNQNGVRFCDECASGAEGSGFMAPRQPRGAIVALCDAEWAKVAERMPPCHESLDWTHGVQFQLAIDPIAAKMDACGYGANDNGVYKADTLDELLDLIGVYNEKEKAAALAEIERYNGFAAAGRDEDFATDPRILKALDVPPFYAYVAQSDAIAPGLCQACGLDTDAEHRVLNDQLRPIPGLFAIGNSSGNRFVINYCTPVSGMSLAYCLTEGMQCGAYVASL